MQKPFQVNKQNVNIDIQLKGALFCHVSAFNRTGGCTEAASHKLY